MKLTRKHIIGILGVVGLLLIGAWLPRAFAPGSTPVDTDPAYVTQLKEELTTWGSEYNVKVEAKTQHEDAVKTINGELRELSCKALSNRIALCQRGKDEYCQQEQDARASMQATYGAPFETVCRRDFTKQATGS